jgi:hypothetical protein
MCEFAETIQRRVDALPASKRTEYRIGDLVLWRDHNDLWRYRVGQEHGCITSEDELEWLVRCEQHGACLKPPVAYRHDIAPGLPEGSAEQQWTGSRTEALQRACDELGARPTGWAFSDHFGSYYVDEHNLVALGAGLADGHDVESLLPHLSLERRRPPSSEDTARDVMAQLEQA